MPTNPDAVLEVCGVVLSRGTPAMETDLRLDRGLHAVYGRNGVGKTQMLRRIAKTLGGFATGTAADAVVLRVATHMPVGDGPAAPEAADRIDDGYDEDEHDEADRLQNQDAPDDPVQLTLNRLRPYPNHAFAAELHRVLRKFARELVQSAPDADDETTDRSIEGLVEVIVRRWLWIRSNGPERPASDACATAIDAIANEVARQGLFQLGAWGSAEPAFGVTIAVRPDATAPVLRHEVEALVRARATLDATTTALHEQPGDVSAAEAEAWRRFDAAVTDNPMAWMMADDVEADEVHHPWIPFALIPAVGTVRRPIDGVTVIGPGPVDADHWTRRALGAHIDDHRDTGVLYFDVDQDPATVGLPPDPEALARLGLGAIVDRARAVADRLLEDPPRLQASYPSALEFLTHPPALWTADDSFGARVPLDALSRAQERLLSLAVGIATETAITPLAGQVIVLIDEPELGLHRRAERRLTDALASLADDLGATIVCATHSPELLGERRAVLHHVTRTGEGVIVSRAMANDVAQDVEALGCSAADLFQLAARIVVVDDFVDAAVIRALDDGVVTDRPSLFIPVRGGPGCPAIGTGAIWDLTEAKVVAVLSQPAHAVVAPLWERIVARPPQTAGDRLRAAAELRSLTDGGTGPSTDDRSGAEVIWFVDLAVRALDDGRTDRVSCVGLTGPSVAACLGIAASEGVPGSTEAVLAAVTSLDCVPDDVVRVLTAAR
jgi:ABC-type transport system involved in cytochrome c biogenesis ATPase subunit